MPRKPQFFLPDVPVHIVQRGHSREPVFFEASDYQACLGWLEEAAERYHCDIHAYVLMTNHILATPHDKQGISRMMQYIGRRYVQSGKREHHWGMIISGRGSSGNSK